MSPKEMAEAIRAAQRLPKPPPVDTYGENVRARNRECMRRIRAAKKAKSVPQTGLPTG